MIDRHVTVASFTQRWLPDGWTFHKLFEWPPDVFAWTSALLQKTGAYRMAASPPDVWPTSNDWTGDVAAMSSSWLKSVEDSSISLPTEILQTRDEVVSLAVDVTLAGMRSPTKGSREWRLCKAALELHAYADRCCRGFGSPAINTRTAQPRTQYLSDLLLATSGSVARLPRDAGVVLPKMRTPQTGVTLRALSLYASYHETELEIAWRSLPWANIDEDTLNILVVPWPYVVHATDFRPRSMVGQRTRNGRARYFAFEPARTRLNPSAILEMLESVHASHSKRIHIVVFPELALTRQELRELQDHLTTRLEKRTQIPMVVAGLRRDSGIGGAMGTEERVDCNSVVLSMFFAERWYNLEQDKHHRWKLDPGQIEQYNLGGVLTGTAPWWEACEMRQRRLTFMAPNDWLVLSPLVCEDLAQLDPVSEVIRGVGPTLIWALLLDGPQLPQRWSARYASVLADDPGSSVLTVTAAGMAQRSQPKAHESSLRDEGTVATWRDAASSLRTVSLPDTMGAAVLTLAVEWGQEHTLDGRRDDFTTSQFVLKGVQPVPLDRERAIGDRPTSSVEEPGRKRRTRTARDLKEVTAFTIFIDAALDAPAGERAQFAAWLLQVRSGHREVAAALSSAHADIVALIGHHTDEQDKDRELELAVQVALELLEPMTASDASQLTIHWSRVAKAAEAALQELQDGQVPHLRAHNAASRTDFSFLRRVHVAVWNAVLWAVHTRLTEERRDGALQHAGHETLQLIEDALDRRFDSLLDAHE